MIRDQVSGHGAGDYHYPPEPRWVDESRTGNIPLGNEIESIIEAISKEDIIEHHPEAFTSN